MQGQESCRHAHAFSPPRHSAPVFQPPCLPVARRGGVRPDRPGRLHGVPNSMPGLDRASRFDPDDFNTNASIYTRHLDAPPARVCEGARRALLSQGYLVGTASAEVVAGRKYFQPSTDIHYQVEMRVVCASEGPEKQRTAVFASALQDRYVIKKINNSASLGVGALGSLSLPVTA
ncbi:DUF2242 domain-containing protein, partial [Acidovorax cattleyae]|nr:DUF2242 domain-containing protein [Paracidovorax cattleyae]